MPFQKLQFRPGINRDLTALANEGGWYEGNNVRFRSGYPEKIGGWQRISTGVFQGICRSLCAWVSLTGFLLFGIGTNLKMYVAYGGQYFDITPLAGTVTIAANAFTTTAGSNVIVANLGASHGGKVGNYVAVTGALSTVGGIAIAVLNGDFLITAVTGTTITYTLPISGSGVTAATGGNAAFGMELDTGAVLDSGSVGWGVGGWGTAGGGGWGVSSGTNYMRVWNQVSYGELLVFGQRQAAPYVFYPTLVSNGFNRGVAMSSLSGATGTPLFQTLMFFSPAARILVFCGTNSTLNSTYDPMLVRWADSDSLTMWTPAITNAAGEYRLPRGSQIVAAAAARQDQLILTDTAAYLMQYIGAPYIFGFTQQSDNISIASPRAIASAMGTLFWMGTDKFYVFDGRVQPLPCVLMNEVFLNINTSQFGQVFAGTNEGFNEVWWFYCSAASTTPDKYVVYNYTDKIWYYGSMNRTAWLDTPLAGGPLAAMTFGNLVTHETGVDDLSTATTLPIDAYIKSADFDIGDGQNYAFVRKVLPDLNFAGSNAMSPQVYLTVQGRKNPGGNATTTPAQAVVLTATSPSIRFTDEVHVRIRARQMNIKIESVDIGVKWQFGTPRIDVRPDGRAA